MRFAFHRPISKIVRLHSQCGQAVVEMVLAIPILIALFAACLQLLHLGMAHIIVELAAYEATRQATLANMNIADARSTAEDICKVLGPGRTEVKYQDNPAGYIIIHHLRTIVPMIRELKVEHSFPSYVFLPAYDLVPGSAASPSQGGSRGGNSGNSPDYNPNGSGGGSQMEVVDYDPDDYSDRDQNATQGNNGTTSANPSVNPLYFSSVNPQTLPEGLEPYHSPPGADYSESMDEEYASDAYEPSDGELHFNSNLTNTEENATNISSGSDESTAGGSSRTAGDYLAAGAAAVGGSIWPMPLLPTDTIAEAGKRARDKTGGVAAGEAQERESLLPENLDKDTTGVEAFGKGFAETSLGDTHEDDAYLPTHRWANKTTKDYRDKSSRYREALDDMDKEADKEKGLKKITDKAKIKATKAAVAGSNLLAEAALDIPKAGQDLPEAGRNTADAAKKLAQGDFKGALRDGGRAVGLLGREAGRLSIVGGISRKAGKKLLKEGGEAVAERTGTTIGRQTENVVSRNANRTGISWEQYKKTNTIGKNSLDVYKKMGGQTEVVERTMSRAELEATQKTGLLRGGRETGDHFVTNNANKDALRARQRLALPQTPEVRVKIEVPKDAFPDATKVRPNYKMPGGGVERNVSGKEKIPVNIIEIQEYK